MTPLSHRHSQLAPVSSGAVCSRDIFLAIFCSFSDLCQCASPLSWSVYQTLGRWRPFQPLTSEDPIKDVCNCAPASSPADLQESTDAFVKTYESAGVIDHAVNVTV